MTIEAIGKVGLRFLTYEYGVHQYMNHYGVRISVVESINIDA